MWCVPIWFWGGGCCGGPPVKSENIVFLNPSLPSPLTAPASIPSPTICFTWRKGDTVGTDEGAQAGCSIFLQAVMSYFLSTVMELVCSDRFGKWPIEGAKKPREFGPDVVDSLSWAKKLWQIRWPSHPPRNYAIQNVAWTNILTYSGIINCPWGNRVIWFLVAVPVTCRNPNLVRRNRTS